MFCSPTRVKILVESALLLLDLAYLDYCREGATFATKPVTQRQDYKAANGQSKYSPVTV